MHLRRLTHGFVGSVLPDKGPGLRKAVQLSVKSAVAIQGTKDFLDWSRDHKLSDGKIEWSLSDHSTNRS